MGPRFLVLAALLTVASALPSHGDAQPRPSARRVAAEVQSFYDQTRTFESRFLQIFYNQLYGRYSRSSGQLTFAKPGRMRFDYARPNGKIVVADGQALTMFEPGDQGEPGQLLRTPMADDSVPAAFSFLLGQGRLEQDFRFRLLSSRRYRTRHHVLELRPRSPDPRYRRVILFVDARPRLAGVVHRIRIDDHQRNRNTFIMRRMRFNRRVAPSRFRFTAPQGTRSVRL